MSTANSSSSTFANIFNAVKSAVSAIAKAVKSIIAPTRADTDTPTINAPDTPNITAPAPNNDSTFDTTTESSSNSQTLPILFPFGRQFSIARMLNGSSATLFSEEIMMLAEEVTFNGETITQEAEITARFTFSGSGNSSNGRLHLVDVQLTSINTGNNTISITSNLVNLGQFPDQFKFNLGSGANFEVIIETVIPFDVQVSTPTM